MTTNFELTAATVYQPLNNLLAATPTRAAVSTKTNHPVLAEKSFHDTATLSTTGLLSTEAADSDKSRTDYVAAIGRSIAAGTYSVSANDVATSILDSLS